MKSNPVAKAAELQLKLEKKSHASTKRMLASALEKIKNLEQRLTRSDAYGNIARS